MIGWIVGPIVGLAIIAFIVGSAYGFRRDRRVSAAHMAAIYDHAAEMDAGQKRIDDIRAETRSLLASRSAHTRRPGV